MIYYIILDNYNKMYKYFEVKIITSIKISQNFYLIIYIIYSYKYYM